MNNPLENVERRLRLVVNHVPQRYLYVDMAAQSLSVIDSGRCTRTFRVSTSARGPGCQNGSMRTPTGIHRVARAIGGDAALGAIFIAREPTGERWQNAPADKDLVLTRILWLEGLEEGVNRGGEVDTFERFIYIHGTNHEDTLGSPASHGCIRMSNTDIIELFDIVQEGTVVVID